MTSARTVLVWPSVSGPARRGEGLRARSGTVPTPVAYASDQRGCQGSAPLGRRGPPRGWRHRSQPSRADVPTALPITYVTTAAAAPTASCRNAEIPAGEGHAAPPSGHRATRSRCSIGKAMCITSTASRGRPTRVLPPPAEAVHAVWSVASVAAVQLIGRVGRGGCLGLSLREVAPCPLRRPGCRPSRP